MNQQLYMYYHKAYGCWLKVDGDCGRAMNVGESFKIHIGEGINIPCRLGLAGKHLWYLEIGLYQVKLNLRINEIYEIEY